MPSRALLSLVFLVLIGCPATKPPEDTGTATQTDADNDGWLASEDCDDTSATVYPGATEICNGVDDDCDGAIDEDLLVTWYADDDGDGYGDPAVTTDACDRPSGYVPTANDCDDTRADVNPGAPEICDGIDNNCNEEADEGVAAVWHADGDGDGFGAPFDSVLACDAPTGFVADATDCDDTRAEVNPAGAEVCDDLDNDCDGYTDDADPSVTGTTWWFLDADADGWGDVATSRTACEPGPGWVADFSDCDDADPGVNPGAVEICDLVDDDCDTLVDEADPDLADGSTWYTDADGDLYGDPATAVLACVAPAGTLLDGTDCDDARADVHPGAIEVCDGVDDDCDGLADDADPAVVDPSTWYADLDADGYGDPSAPTISCVAPAFTSADGTDCDDGRWAVHPGGPEICDGFDNDCDGLADDADPDRSDAGTWYPDGDGDGFGDDADPVVACDAPSGWVADPTDCDDASTDVHPGAIEICDTLDDDCDGLTDEADPDLAGATAWYTDADRDGYGDPATGALACDVPISRVLDGTDCDDASAAVYPGALEVCDGIDDDCDALTDEADPDLLGATTWYLDADADGFGDETRPTAACALPAGYAASALDCDDTRSTVFPGASETCDGIDDDCDGLVDDADPVLTGAPAWYADLDADGYGDPTAVLYACVLPSGALADDTDCDDLRADVNPGAVEVCDGVDDDCDGLVDDADSPVTGRSTWYVDADGDGWGDAATTTTACDAGRGWATVYGDCNDGDASINPGALEICSTTADDDCDGVADACAVTGRLDLGTADARVDGTDTSDYAGTRVAWIGDNNGDGIDDFAVSAPYHNAAPGSDSGQVYVFYGPLTSHVKGDKANAAVYGESTSDRLGSDLAGAGDMDGDGYDDFLVGAYLRDGPDDDEGAAYIVYGPFADSTARKISDTSVDAVVLTGIDRGDEAGWAVSSTGDLNGDDIPEVLVGAPGEYASAYGDAGAVRVLYGPFTSDESLSSADVIFSGKSSSDLVGSSVTGRCDINGDGGDDLVFGVPGEDDAGSDAGAVFIAYTPKAGSYTLGSADVEITGMTRSDGLGDAVACLGNGDGDGYDDLLVTAMDYDTYSNGAAWVVPGPLDGMVELADVETLQIVGDRYGSSGDYLGSSISRGGDVNGDGVDDILVGAWKNDDGASDGGAAYLVLMPQTGDIDMETPTALTPYATFLGEETSDSAGVSVALDGDGDGDGYDDVLIGALYADYTTDANTGSAYLFYGGLK